MSILQLLWVIANLLTAASAVILCGVIVSRAVTNRRARIEAGRGQALAPLLLAEPTPGAVSPQPAGRRLLRVTGELLGPATGAERARILANAERLGVTRQLRDDLQSRSLGRRSTAATLLEPFPVPRASLH